MVLQKRITTPDNDGMNPWLACVASVSLCFLLFRKLRRAKAKETLARKPPSSEKRPLYNCQKFFQSDATPQYNMPYHATPRYAMLCYGTLRYTIYAMLCYATTYYYIFGGDVVIVKLCQIKCVRHYQISTVECPDIEMLYTSIYENSGYGYTVLSVFLLESFFPL